MEIWPEDRPEDRYFDPIALLGAETPKRDLGLIYSKGTTRGGKRPVRYEMGAAAAAPSGTNTFLPGGDNRKKQNAKGADAMPQQFSTEQLDQLTEVIRSIVAPMIDEAAIGNDAGAPPEPEFDPNMPPPADPMAGAGAPADPMMGAPAPAPMPPGPADPMGGGDEIPGLEPEEDDQMNYMQGMYAKFQKYGKGEEFDEGGAGAFLDTLDGEESEQFRKYMMENGDDDDKMQYSKCTGADISDEDQPEAAQLQKYRKRALDVSAKYRNQKRIADKYQKENAELKHRLADLQQAERYQRRRRTLTELEAQGLVLDVADEMAHTDGYSDQAFEDHVTHAAEHYAKVPMGHLELGQHLPKPSPGTMSEGRSRRIGDEARKRVLEARRKGQDGDAQNYSKVRAQVEAEDKLSAV